jgi:hypothetical protein
VSGSKLLKVDDQDQSLLRDASAEDRHGGRPQLNSRFDDDDQSYFNDAPVSPSNLIGKGAGLKEKEIEATPIHHSQLLLKSSNLNK